MLCLQIVHTSKEKVSYKDAGDDECDSDSDDDLEYDESEFGTEAYELRSETVFDVISKDTVRALSSPPDSIQFFLFKVSDFGIAVEDMQKGEKFIKGCYLEKTLEKMYKLVKTEVYVLPTQVMLPLVTINEDLSITVGECSWLVVGITIH